MADSIGVVLESHLTWSAENLAPSMQRRHVSKRIRAAPEMELNVNDAGFVARFGVVLQVRRRIVFTQDNQGRMPWSRSYVQWMSVVAM